MPSLHRPEKGGAMMLYFYVMLDLKIVNKSMAYTTAKLPSCSGYVRLEREVL